VEWKCKVDAFNVDIDTKFLHNYQVGSPVLEDEEDDVIVSLPNVRAKIQEVTLEMTLKTKSGWLVIIQLIY